MSDICTASRLNTVAVCVCAHLLACIKMARITGSPPPPPPPPRHTSETIGQSLTCVVSGGWTDWWTDVQMDETTGILLRAGAKQPVDRRKAGTLSTKPSFLDGSSHSLIITRHGTAAEAAPVSRRTKGEKAQRQWSGTHEPRARIACSCWQIA